MAPRDATLAYVLGALPSYSFWVPLVGAFLGGEETILIISALSVTGALSLTEVIIFSFLGTMLSDMCWFLFGRKFVGYLEQKPRVKSQFGVISAFIDRVTGQSHFWALLITKFLYGTRIIMIFYLGREKLSFAKFTAYNIVVTAIWSVVICSIGRLAGEGVVNIAALFGNITYGLGVMALAVLAFYLIRVWLNRIIVEGANR